MNQWEQELQKLEKIQDLKMNRELYHIYSDTLKDVKSKLKAYLEEYEDLPYWKQQQTGRLKQLTDEIVEKLQEVYPQAKTVIENFKQEQFETGYYGGYYTVEESQQADLPIAFLPDEVIRSAVRQPVASKTLSERLYKARNRLANRSQGAITSGILQGKGYAEIASVISSNSEANYRQALRIARTEGGRMRTQARQNSYEEMEKVGCDLQKQWLAALDRKTRKSHGHLDGQRVKIDEFFESDGFKAIGPRCFGVASMDINCRCTTITIVDGINPDYRRDNETGEKIAFRTYDQWKKDIDERRFLMSDDDDYMKARNMKSHQLGSKRTIKDEHVSFSGRKVLTSNHDMYVSDSLKGTKKSINYYEKQVDKALELLDLPIGAEKPRIVLIDAKKDLGRPNAFGSYSPSTNTMYLDATTPGHKAIVKRLKNVNKSWKKDGNQWKFFAVDDDSMSPIIHEFGHYQQYQYVNKYAEQNGVSYAEAKRKFNAKLLDMIDKNNYNIARDISGYAEEYKEKHITQLTRTNEILSEAYTLSILKSHALADIIRGLLEGGVW
jgi:SPP1 gp7 family putative phage head morphogenesis protein